MNKQHLRKVWGVPLLLAATILFGLLAALLGTGAWHVLSWIALFVPIGVMIRFTFRWG